MGAGIPLVPSSSVPKSLSTSEFSVGELLVVAQTIDQEAPHFRTAASSP